MKKLFLLLLLYFDRTWTGLFSKGNDKKKIKEKSIMSMDIVDPDIEKNLKRKTYQLR